MQDKKTILKRGIVFIPFLFTLGNAFFGFCSIALAYEGERIAAIYSIFLAAMMDALDGRIARLMRVESDLGVEMDSLCDVISFCLAPAFLIYIWSLRAMGLLGIIVGSLFLLAGVIRLARFNLIHDQQTIFFIGLPTTVAGCFIATVMLNLGPRIYEPWLTMPMALLLLLLSWLMISRIRFPAFKSGKMKVKKHYPIAAATLVFISLAVLRLQSLVLFLFLAYFIFTFGYNIFRHFLKK